MFEPHEGRRINRAPALPILHDLRDPAALERLRRERDAWLGHSEIEMLNPSSAIHLVQPGGIRRLQR